jgi:GTP-binding protein EngB required for normal cell division
MNGLNDNHKRRLRTMFQSVDEMLAEVVRFVDPSQAQSPFSQHRPDATPVQHKVIEDYVARIRERMRRLLEQCGVELPEPHISATWAARTVLTSADIAIEELRPQYMRGYGDLSESTAKELEVLVAELLDLVTRMETYLAHGSGRDLRARLERLERTNDVIPLLQELERVVTEHGLLAFRPTLAMLLERLESNQLEIAVFGRVSSGKSSLLNHVLQTDVLPVGVTPVTAVPTRISFGATPRAVISFAEADQQVIELHRIAEFATEQENPSNAKHVTRIHIEIPTGRLREGITFVDTPGLGSLAEAGTAESLAYLPRCDLGIMLVDASSTLIQEDIALVNALYQAGADVMVLLSKADTLSAEDHERAMAYAGTQLQSNIDIEVPVYLVSVKGENARLCDRWFDEVLVPKLQEHRSLAAASFHRKVGALRESVVAALKKRAVRGSHLPARSTNSFEETNRSLSVALMRLDAARRESVNAIEQPEKLSAELLDRIADDIAAYWKGNPDSDGDAAQIATVTIRRFVGDIAAGVAKSVLNIRSLLADALKHASGTTAPIDGQITDLPSPSGMPAMDASETSARLHVHRSALGFLSTGVVSHGIRKQLETSIATDLQSALYRYGKRLDEWRSRSLRELRQAFTASADLYRAWPDQDQPTQADS